MRGKSEVVLAAAILFVVSIFGALPTQAQRTAPIAGPRSSAHSRPVAMHSVPPRATTGNRTAPAIARHGVHFNVASNSFEASDGSPVSLQELLDPFPDPGFSFQHLSAINQDLGIKAVIDPVTEWKLAIAERVLRDRSRFAGAGFYLLDGGGTYAVPDDSALNDSAPAQQPDQSTQQPQVIVVQAPSSQQSADQPGPEDSAPLPDVGQFTLVLQNGTQLQAVAFTRMNDRIVYITADGSRRTIAIADLNSDATVRVNEERGTPLQFPL
jgi:hypothetical protein